MNIESLWIPQVRYHTVSIKKVLHLKTGLDFSSIVTTTYVENYLVMCQHEKLQLRVTFA